MFHFKLILRLTFLVSIIRCKEKNEIENEELEYLIRKNVNESKFYDFPKDNSKHFENLKIDKVHDYGVFDFIIVGSGSTGSVLANRLSSERSWKILMLEAGEFDNTFTDIPSMYSTVLRSKYNWGYNTTTQKYGCKGMLNGQCSYPRGKILGGSSSINGLIYTRGNPNDYNSWEKLGIMGWNYTEVEKFFRRMENAQFPENNLGKTGPLFINYSSPFVCLQETFFEALSSLGISKTKYNSGSQIGSSRIQSNIKYGRRVSGANAYIRPVMDRKNLNVTIKAFVIKILIDENNKEAYGVRFVQNEKVYDAFVRKEVILSAGAINSPQILMLSGIGPEYLLNKYNIPLIKDLPVGETLIDQIAIALPLSSNYTVKATNLSTEIKDYLKGEGLLTAPFNGKSISFVNKDIEGRPTVELVLLPPTGSSDIDEAQPSPYIPIVNEQLMSKLNPTNFFTMTVILLHPRSVGKVTLKSSRPEDFPLIDSNIFGVKEDIEALHQAVEFVVNMTKTEAFKKINASVFLPIPPCFKHKMYSKKYWHCAIKYMAIPTYHSMGTTSMGVDPKTSVVNNELKVHGIKNLRIADCGIIPTSISGHTNGPAFMIGEKLSTMIKKEYEIED